MEINASGKGNKQEVKRLFCTCKNDYELDNCNGFLQLNCEARNNCPSEGIV